MDVVGKIDRWAEDDSLRSTYIQRLAYTDYSVSQIAPQISCSIPRVIVQYWNDLAAVPSDVQECLDSWTALTARGFARILFDDIRARDFILDHFDSRHAKAYDVCHHPAMRCDYFRLCYLLERGGFYIDADEVYQGVDCSALFKDGRLKLQPLCYDVAADSMISAQVFRTPANASPHWIFYVNNNPLVTPARHPLIRNALARATDALLVSKRPLEIQSTTGPGNLSASLVKHSLQLCRAGATPDFAMIPNWDSISVSRWPLSYRSDERNWRHWNPPKA